MLVLIGLANMAGGVGAAAASPPHELSVMSYNVHGLPWPFASGRTRALSQIGARLAQMRAAGDEPHLVLLQEAFTGNAKAIAREGGYPFVARGPTRLDRLNEAGDLGAPEYSRGDNMLEGERDGTFEDSGLIILSDYPIIAIKTAPFPRFACAGFDCLANKGVLMVRVAFPGAMQPITVFDTHMNSRRASGVRAIRSDAAFGWQAQYLRRFVQDNAPGGEPAIVSGDFNIGRRVYRQAMIDSGGGVLAGGADVLRLALAEGLQSPSKADVETIVTHRKDCMFARSGIATKLTVESYSVPFGRETDGKSLSDHYGYVVRYAITN